MGNKPHFKKVEPESKYLVNSFLYCKPGIYDHLEGFDEMIDEGYMSEYHLFKSKGTKFDSVENSGDRIACFTVQGNTYEELYKKHKKVARNIKVIGSNGEDIMRHDLLTDLK